MKLSKSVIRARLGAIKSWIAAHRTRTIISVSVIILAIAGGVAYALLSQPATTAPHITTKSKPTPPVKYYSPLSGIEVADEAATHAPLTAIMIENSPDARPQSGLKSAEIVYEAIAEGGITRFLTVYQQHKPELIGPVRSLRMYYLDWAAPYRAGIAHIGGSAAALDEVRSGNYYDLDQFFNAGTYWRASDRYAPHNVYTNSVRLDELNAKKGNTKANFTGFARTDGKPVAEPDAATVNVNFSSALYNTRYSYDPATNTYLRQIGGAPHNDREAGQITPSVIIAMHVKMTRVLEDGYRESITTTGSGEAEVFQNGTVTKATWHKNSRGEPLQILDTSGKPLELSRGQTWIAAIPDSTGSVSWQ